MKKTAIDKVFEQYETMKSFLEQQKEISLLNDYTNTFRKILILSCGSYFEAEITQLLKEYSSKCSQGDHRLSNFIYNQAICGRYYSLFDWGKQNDPCGAGSNANKFYKLFGDEFTSEIKADLNMDPTSLGTSKEDTNNSVKEFIKIGHLRNIVVHSNFAEYIYEQHTPEEIYSIYKNATLFIDYIRYKLLES